MTDVFVIRTSEHARQADSTAWETEERGPGGQWESGGGAPRELTELKPKANENLASMAYLPPAIQAKVEENVRERIGVDPAQVPALYNEMFQAAKDRGTSYDEGMHWYQNVHDEAQALADKYGSTLENVAGIYASMSPGMLWDAEHNVVNAIIEMNAQPINMDQKTLDALNDKLVKDYGLDKVANGQAYRDLDVRTAVIAMHSQYMCCGVGAQHHEDTGWGVRYGYGGFQRGLEVLRGDKSVEEALNGVKVREFYDNIAHPEIDGHTTIDVMMMRSLNKDQNFQNNTHITGYPAYKTVAVGPTPLLADVVREIAAREGILANQAQAIIWSEWLAQQKDAGHGGVRGGTRAPKAAAARKNTAVVLNPLKGADNEVPKETSARQQAIDEAVTPEELARARAIKQGSVTVDGVKLADWNPEDHPRGEGGRFGEGEGSKPDPAAVQKASEAVHFAVEDFAFAHGGHDPSYAATRVAAKEQVARDVAARTHIPAEVMAKPATDVLGERIASLARTNGLDIERVGNPATTMTVGRLGVDLTGATLAQYGQLYNVDKQIDAQSSAGSRWEVTDKFEAALHDTAHDPGALYSPEQILGAAHDALGIQADSTQGLVSMFVDQWANTASDTNPNAISEQMMVAEHFGLKEDASSLMAHYEHEAADWSAHGVPLGMSPDEVRAQAEHETPLFGAILDGMKANTDEHLAALGVKPTDNLQLYRGVGSNQTVDVPEYNDFHVATNPMSSWTTDASTAEEFGDTVVVATIPASEVLSTTLTGFGALPEYEVVTLSDPARLASVDNPERYAAAGPKRPSVWVDEPPYDDWIKTVGNKRGVHVAWPGQAREHGKFDYGKMDESKRTTDPTQPGIHSAVHTTTEANARDIAAHGFDPIHTQRGELGKGDYFTLKTPSGQHAQERALETPRYGPNERGPLVQMTMDVSYQHPFVATAEAERAYEQEHGQTGEPSLASLASMAGLKDEWASRAEGAGGLWTKGGGTPAEEFTAMMRDHGYDALVWSDPNGAFPRAWGDQVVVYDKAQVKVVDDGLGSKQGAAGRQLRLVSLEGFLASFGAPPATASVDGAPVRLADWDPEAHPKGPDGRFESTGGERQLGGRKLEDWQKPPSHDYAMTHALEVQARRDAAWEKSRGDVKPEVRAAEARIRAVIDPNGTGQARAVDLKDVAPKLAAEVADRVEAFQKETGLGDRISSVVMMNTYGSTSYIAQTIYSDGGTAHIELSSTYYSENTSFGGPSYFEQVQREAYEQGAHVSPTTASAMDHELGHVLDHALEAGLIPKTMEFSSPTAGEGTHTSTYGQASEYGSSNALFTSPYRLSDLSGYANTNQREAFAEAYAMHVAGTAGQYRKDFNADINKAIADARLIPSNSAITAAAAPKPKPTCVGYVPDEIAKSAAEKLGMPWPPPKKASITVDGTKLAYSEDQPRDSHGRFGEGDGGGKVDVAKLVADNPQKPGESTFEWQARIVDGLPAQVKSDVLFQTRETYAPVPYIAQGAARWCEEHGLPAPPSNIIDTPVNLKEAQAVAEFFDQARDRADDPVVQEAYADFKQQSEAMFEYMTRPESEGGLGVKVDFTNEHDPYSSAKAQADDLRDNHHITLESGLGGAHEASMTREEYDRFRAVHDVFGHAGVGGGFDRHGEYEAWLMHASMYTDPGRLAMSTEYHGVNSALWGSPPTQEYPGTGITTLLPEGLGTPPWDRKVAAATAPKAHVSATSKAVVEALGLDDSFAGQYDDPPWHPHPKTRQAYSESQPRDDHGRFGEGDGAKLTVKDYEGQVGNRDHITRVESGTLPTSAVAHLEGVRGEQPGQHGAAERQGKSWEDFKADIRENGIHSPIFITVDHGEAPKISEGNTRRDVAVELGLKNVPVEIRYFGHAEQEGTVAERASTKQAYSEDQPRDADGRFGTGDGAARPEFDASHQAPVQSLLDGKAAYAEAHALGTPAARDWQAITRDPEAGARTAHDYEALPMHNGPATEAAYAAMRDEVQQQYEYLTNTLGVKVEVVGHDPYPDVKAMRDDVANGHLAVLATASTGGHPFFTNEQNDMFRAVHDAFGHAAIGRGFDRNGEEAAFQSHAQMFSPTATAALATETRGQNSVLVYGAQHEFPPQKFALLPPNDYQPTRQSAAQTSQADADADNQYGYTRCHHTSCGRSLHDDRPQGVGSSDGRQGEATEPDLDLAAAGPGRRGGAGRVGGAGVRGPRIAVDGVEVVHVGYSEDQPRDSHGRFGEGGGTVERIDSSRGAIGVRRVEALQRELDHQGVPKDSPIRGVIDHPYDQMAIARAKDGGIVGALAFSRDAGGVWLNDFRASEKGTGIGTALMQHVAQEAMTTRGQEINFAGAVPGAVPFYQRMGAEFSAQTVNSAVQSKPGEVPPADKLTWGTYGHIDPAGTKALADGHPIDKRETIQEAYARTQREGGNPHFAYPGQPREAGRFAEGKESETTGAPNVAHSSIIDKIAKEGGISIQPVSGKMPEHGFMVGHPNGAIHKAAEFFKDKATGKGMLKDFVRSHAGFFKGGGYLGAWFDHEHNEVALDRVENIADREQALALARENDQQAIRDLDNNVDIPTGGTGGRQSTVGPRIRIIE